MEFQIERVYITRRSLNDMRRRPRSSDFELRLLSSIHDICILTPLISNFKTFQTRFRYCGNDEDIQEPSHTTARTSRVSSFGLRRGYITYSCHDINVPWWWEWISSIWVQCRSEGDWSGTTFEFDGGMALTEGSSPRNESFSPGKWIFTINCSITLSECIQFDPHSSCMEAYQNAVPHPLLSFMSRVVWINLSWKW